MKHVAIALALLLVAACDPPDVDAEPDGGSGIFLPPLRDGGLPPAPDAGPLPVERDAGPTVEPDAGPSPPDSGPPPPSDAGPAQDAGSGEPDAGPVILMSSAEGGPCFVEAGAVCDDGLVCAPYYQGGAGTCARACDVEGAACVAPGGSCVDYGADGAPFLVCADTVAAGTGCDPERLVTCANDGACLPNDDEPLGGTCRTPCACTSGTTCSTAACGAEQCIVVDFDTGDGFCGTPALAGDACDPVGAGVFCEGIATCLTDGFGDGTCRLRCETPGASDPVCSALASHACFGEPGEGYCLPTTDLGQDELCTDGTTTPAIPLSCAAGFGCVHLDEHPAGYGLCLEACATSATCETGQCWDLETVAPGAGARCLSELPLGARGCDYPLLRCEGASPLCVELNEGETICKPGCTIADCPGASCPCAVDESCVSTFLASTTTGVCGKLATLGERCDEDADLYCEPAPDEATAGNAFSLCAADRCYFLCHYTSPSTGTVVDLACPAGMECRQDPTGRLLSTVSVCVDVP